MAQLAKEETFTGAQCPLSLPVQWPHRVHSLDLSAPSSLPVSLSLSLPSLILPFYGLLSCLSSEVSLSRVLPPVLFYSLSLKEAMDCHP